MKIILAVIAAIFIIALAFYLWPLIFVGLICYASYKIYERKFFRGKFLDLKNRVSSYVKDCNELNKHIESLKETGLIDNRNVYGHASYTDESKWNMKRPELNSSANSSHKIDCSRQVCDSAQKDPFKYLCKYFEIDINEETLERFETILNNFEAAEEGKKSLIAERENIVDGIKAEIPPLIKRFNMKRVAQELGFEPVDLSTVYFPRYIFQYTSSGGNASTRCEIVMDVKNLNDFVLYLSEKIKFKKSASGQRALMTSKLRQQIKERDNYTCRCCGLSTFQEPHLLLEIDHIVPVAKGGLTAEDNLQTLCWKCNRSKGAKIL